MQVETAENAAGALERLRAAEARGDPFRVLLLDHHMPGTDGVALGRRVLGEPAWADIPIVLLTSGGQRGDGARAKDAGFAGYLVKPVRSDLLRRMLAAVAGGRQDGLLLTRHRLEEAPAGLRGTVLLVEDNEVNRHVARAVLRRLGLDIAEAVNGRDAVHAAARGGVDLILMDLHMPEMDGLEATRAIRAREARGGARVPIVAMTANVLQEARDACRAAGMDDFVSKPFVREQLVATLRRWLPGGAASGAGSGTSPAPQSDPVLDPVRLAAMRAALGEDFAGLVPTFLQSAEGLLGNLAAAAQGPGDAAAMHLHAHTLKSAAGTVGAMALAALARALEAEAHAGRVGNAPRQVAALRAEFERVRAALVAAVQ
jgi:CheY-like chemotaxis protein/HPt (histidine-containing phosphotransfer) domain-containing protein